MDIKNTNKIKIEAPTDHIFIPSPLTENRVKGTKEDEDNDLGINMPTNVDRMLGRDYWTGGFGEIGKEVFKGLSFLPITLAQFSASNYMTLRLVTIWTWIGLVLHQVMSKLMEIFRSNWQCVGW